MRRLVLLTGVLNVEQDKTLAAFLRAKGWGFWHWLEGTWLVTCDEVAIDPLTLLRDHCKLIAPGRHVVVFEVAGVKNWVGFGSAEMFQWFDNEWIR